MSEYQYVEFRAIDRPLDDKALAFMQRQSTRAEITRWSFTNEYHFGDFHGNTIEMLRRGYDVHLHYANFGIRKLMFRLPRGLPLPAKQCRQFLKMDGLRWHKDGKGPGGVLEISPYLEPGEVDDLWDLHEWLDRLVPLRQSLVDGDPRPLYAAWLCATIGNGQEAEELAMPPFPVGLAGKNDALAALLEFYELPPDWLAAAAEIDTTGGRAAKAAPRTAVLRETREQHVRAWLRGRDKQELVELCAKWLADESNAVRADTLQAIRDAQPAAAWQLLPDSRTLADVQNTAQGLEKKRNKRKLQADQRARRRRLEKMARDPKQTLKEVDALVSRRNSADYQQAAQLLIDLREALGPEKGPLLVCTQAAALRRKYAGRNQLISVLKKSGLLAPP
jgi:hypothetical protein